MPGGEEGPGAWGAWVTGTGPGGGPGYLENYLRYMVFQDPAWSVLKGNLDEASAQRRQRPPPFSTQLIRICAAFRREEASSSSITVGTILRSHR